MKPKIRIPLMWIAAGLIVCVIVTFMTPTTAKINVRDINKDACNGGDDSAVLQQIINLFPVGGVGMIIIPASGCAHSQTLSANGRDKIIVRGESALSSGGPTASLITYTGSGSRAWDLRSRSAWSFENIAFGATNPAFNGSIIDASSDGSGGIASQLMIRDSSFILTGVNAPTCINIAMAIETVIEHNKFTACNVAIQGENAAFPAAANVVTRILNNEFFATIDVPINDCGDTWTIEGNVFEQQRVTNSASGMRTTSARPCRALGMKNNWLGDGNANGTWFKISAKGAVIGPNRFGNGTVAIELDGGDGLVIEGNSADTVVSFLKCTNLPVGRFGVNSFVNVTNQTIGDCSQMSTGGGGGGGGSSPPVWQSWAPTVWCAAGGVPTGSIDATYLVFGKTADVRISYQFTALNGCGGDVNFSMPPGVAATKIPSTGFAYNLANGLTIAVIVSSLPSIQFKQGASSSYSGSLRFQIN